ncbi:MAG: glycoside hydrolase family 15 protein [Bacteroidota bacterium]
MTHKYNYGIIGNCSYLALVDDQANIGWMCWPRFDSSFIFGTLLDEDSGGQFSVQPEWDEYESTQSYIHNTNVIETHFECEEGSFKVIDFAPRFWQNERFYKPLMLVRKVIPTQGTPRIRVRCQPVGDYGETIPTLSFGSNHIRYSDLQSNVRLTTNVPLSYVEKEQAFVLNEPKYLILTWGVPLESSLESTAEIFLDKTIKYWQKWVKNTSTERFYQHRVIRSALALKLHQYQDTGAIIAAATTSLPEFPGSSRNWDYRFCWLRDAHYTIKALNDLSHFGILETYATFIQNIVLGEDQRFHPLYPITIDRKPVEKIIPLSGYRGERPVRIGNQAYEHIQNDVYGQVLVTLLPIFSDQRLRTDQHNVTLGNLAMDCLKMIEVTMEEPDNGLWEFRGITQLHCYTFLFHWAGAQAARKIAIRIGNDSMKELAEKMIERSQEMIESCYDPERGVYTQAVGSANLDASLLQLINMGYLDPNSEKTHRHLKVLEENLRAPSGLFYRYKHVDDFGEPESTFLICAFWYVEALARIGRVDEAIEIFERLQAHGNHLGLLSEDVHEKTGSQWGNFPQTYSHVGLINAAFTISRKQDKPEFL